MVQLFSAGYSWHLLSRVWFPGLGKWMRARKVSTCSKPIACLWTELILWWASEILVYQATGVCRKPPWAVWYLFVLGAWRRPATIVVHSGGIMREQGNLPKSCLEIFQRCYDCKIKDILKQNILYLRYLKPLGLRVTSKLKRSVRGFPPFRYANFLDGRW